MVIFCCFDCLLTVLTVFDEWYTVPIVKKSQKQSKDSQNSNNHHWCTNRHRSTRTVQQCTNVYQSSNSPEQSKTVKRQSKQQKWPLVYQSSHVYQDCTNSVPIVKKIQKQSKHSQKSTKMTIGVPIVTGLPRLYSLPIVNKNLAIANRSRVSFAHNTSRAFMGLNITPWPWNLD